MDCFASLAMTVEIVSRSRGALRPRFASFLLPSLKTEGAGKTGCLLHPRSRVPLRTARDAHEHTGTAGASRPSLRNGFTVYFVLFPENGCFASVAGETALDPIGSMRNRQLNASTAAPEPHDFAVRVRRARLSRPQRPPHLTARS